MAFRSRNAYYLRMSSTTILPLYLYLDDRHIGWMSDRVLQHVLADLRPLIIPKLQAERDTHFGPGAVSGKKGTVEVHRGDFYQFAYFFRKIEPHSIVTKTRDFVAAPPRQVLPPSNAARSNKKRRPTRGNRGRHKRQRTINESEESTPSIEDSDGSMESRTGDETQDQGMDFPDLDVEMEEEKPKPLLRLKYQALTISGHCLCVVVEPWSSPQHPIARQRTVPPLSAVPPDFGSLREENLALRGQTPLFFPDFDETFDQVDDGFDNAALMNFSQTLNTADHIAAVSDDDDDMDGAVLFGDADEIREFS